MNNFDRRMFLRTTGQVAAGAALGLGALPTTGRAAAAGAGTASASAGAGASASVSASAGAGATGAGAGAAGAAGAALSPDELFVAGRFSDADRGFAAILRRNPRDAHALGQRGRIALFSNRFAAAERLLSRAIELAPGDVRSKRELADCFVRQDQVARAVPLLRSTGDQFDAAFATQYGSMSGPSYQLSGARETRVPFVCVDPLPAVPATANGAKGNFLIDTGATLALTTETAERAGLRALATSISHPAGQTLTTYHGVMESFRVGDIVMRNVPVVWYDLRMPLLPDGTKPAGVIGTTLLYHFLATMDYRNQALILRRKTQRPHHRGQGLPLWLAADHIPFTLGSLNDYGPRVASLDTGGIGLGILATEENAKRAGIEIDYDHPIPGGFYPIKPARVSLGRVVGRNLPGLVGPWPWRRLFGFETIGNFSHEFFKPYAITFDYTAMTFTISTS
ncbi:aspartyl protease family protein [Kribbella catacumbae]|uniref:aspartyl protease family protein n=1 Tax=Kribbella catacumbae TaxID=460086 RepID=UPI00039C206A|nr:aspartyl protease family protein [Kribbella catacumbae]